MERNEKEMNKYILPVVIAIVIIVALIAIVVFTGSTDEEDTDNERPIAVASGDVVVRKGETVILDASNSSDPDGDDLEYFWDVDPTVDSDNDGDMTNDKDLVGMIVTHTFDDVSPGDVVVVTLTVTDGQYEDVDTLKVTIEDGIGDTPPNVFMTVTYGDPVGIVADPHYIITINTVTRMEPISSYTYEIKNEEDDVILAGELNELLSVGLNETVRYVDLMTSPEGIGNVSEGDTILVRDIAPVVEGYTFHLRYLSMTEDAGMVTLLKDLVS